MEIIVEIRKSTELERTEIANVHIKAFGEEKGPEIAELVQGLMTDNTAAPLLSLVAVENKKIIGHILFTKSEILDSTEPVSVRILAPLAVLPEAQSAGIGGTAY